MKKLWHTIAGWFAHDPDDEYLDDEERTSEIMNYVMPGQTINKGIEADTNPAGQQKRQTTK